MILQAILENAALYRLADAGASKLVLRSLKKRTWCCCSVCYNSPGIHVSQARKQAHYPDKESFEIRLLQEKAGILNQLYPEVIEIA